MDEQEGTFDQSELSAEDLAILQAFQEMDDLEVGSPAPAGSSPPQVEPSASEQWREPVSSPAGSETSLLDDMLVLFVTEADEDITTMRQALTQLEQDDSLNAESLTALQRTAHKLKGTAGAVGCTSMSTIAYYIEMLVGLVQEGTLPPMIGLMALVQAMRALEATLQSLLNTGQESSTPLTELEADYEALNEFGSMYRSPSENLIAFSAEHDARLVQGEMSDEPRTNTSPLKEEIAHHHIASHGAHNVHSPLPSAHVDLQRLKQLVLRSEALAEQHAPLESAHDQIETALEELNAAQARLQYLEAVLSLNVFAAPETPSNERARPEYERPMSSLVARILDEAEQHGRHTPAHPQHRTGARAIIDKAREATSWDEMEVDRYTERDVLLRAFSEAIADVATASAQVRSAFTAFSRILRKHMSLASDIRNDTLLLRSAPLATLLPRIQRAIRMSADAQRRQIHFEVRGEMTEIDQDILEALARPLLQLVRYCVVDNLSSGRDEARSGRQEHRTWLVARSVGNEVTIELGFSTAVRAGALDLVRGSIQQLNGAIRAERNTFGGQTFYLTLPRSHGALHGLLARVGSQNVVVPFLQVQRINYGEQQGAQETLLSLNALLGFPEDQSAKEQARPVLVLQPGSTSRFVQVDEVLGAIEVVVKPLAPYLQRPGIAGVAIDGPGNVLLILDLPGLLAQSQGRRPAITSARADTTEATGRAGRTVLVADDSVYIRQSLQQILSRAGYHVLQARDGKEAWKQLLEEPPDALLLDIEMPNLNGYELLSMIHTSPQLSQIKIIMLTARSSSKHQRSAFELGAHAYLIKPSSSEMLLETLQKVLSGESAAAP